MNKILLFCALIAVVTSDLPKIKSLNPTTENTSNGYGPVAVGFNRSSVISKSKSYIANNNLKGNYKILGTDCVCISGNMGCLCATYIVAGYSNSKK
jgi:hypothetical protein